MLWKIKIIIAHLSQRLVSVPAKGDSKSTEHSVEKKTFLFNVLCVHFAGHRDSADRSPVLCMQPQCVSVLLCHIETYQNFSEYRAFFRWQWITGRHFGDFTIVFGSNSHNLFFDFATNFLSKIQVFFEKTSPIFFFHATRKKIANE